jgi:hypothetical protein
MRGSKKLWIGLLVGSMITALVLLAQPYPVQSKPSDDSIQIEEEDPCWPYNLPVGAIPGQPEPVFCKISEQGPDTAKTGENSWLDLFNHDLSFADFTGTPYRVFENVGFVYRTLHWRHTNHWMVDVATRSPETPVPWVRGGALLSPDRTFRFEDGKLIVEAEAAAGITEYGTNAWPEIVISTGSKPYDNGSLYAYDLFPEDWTLGCRLQATRYPVCTLKDNSGSQQGDKESERIWEMSAHQPVGTTNQGGSPFQGREQVWNLCEKTDPDMYCRDHFRLELAETTLTLYVNGNKYFEQTDIPDLPDELLKGDIYVYFASMVVSHPAEAVRFHWDGLAVNVPLADGTVDDLAVPLLKEIPVCSGHNPGEW